MSRLHIIYILFISYSHIFIYLHYQHIFLIIYLSHIHYIKKILNIYFFYKIISNNLLSKHPYNFVCLESISCTILQCLQSTVVGAIVASMSWTKVKHVGRRKPRRYSLLWPWCVLFLLIIVPINYQITYVKGTSLGNFFQI